ncbi:hypothetical protein BDQ94DRAFT_78933 [Aspergillus welwitschiae]|uniref:Uncharacterized protein n=1 Tax=Aspergillus welwitschiae TaxID=1341132 RepID=A0A3F3PT57_9EURO|nr:hypothetical protein BDQ94DRAFT_78933 [Aspergillus welwitschiae]RDH30073.1 hypothetical protein BDQ94DRAFT_78933 [Aspergillus welwitschiae]
MMVLHESCSDPSLPFFFSFLFLFFFSFLSFPPLFCLFFFLLLKFLYFFTFLFSSFSR